MSEVLTKVKKTRTPKNYDSIAKGAVSLSLGERVRLVKLLQDSITDEVETLNEVAKQATALANGTK